MSPTAAAQAIREFVGTAENRQSVSTPGYWEWVVADKPVRMSHPLPNDNGQPAEPSAGVANADIVSPRALLLDKYKVALPLPAFEVRQQWEGTVSEVGDSEFVAVLADLTEPTRAREQAVFSLDEVPDEDHELVVPGGVFYWSIGYERGRGGQKKSTSLIRFRRLPAWTTREIDAVHREARELLNDFGSEDSETDAAGSR